jgi:hypothetical protein
MTVNCYLSSNYINIERMSNRKRLIVGFSIFVLSMIIQYLTKARSSTLTMSLGVVADILIIVGTIQIIIVLFKTLVLRK